MPQLVYTDAPAAGVPGMQVDLGLHDVISRVVSTQKLASVQIDATVADGTYTITIDGVIVGTFAATSSNQAAVAANLLADLQASDAPIVASAGAAGQILIEGTDEYADFAISVGGPAGDITLTTLVPYGQEVPFGVGLVKDDRAAVSGVQARLPRQATDITGGGFLGTSLADTSQEYNAGGYKDGSAVPIEHRGRIYVIAENAVAEGAAVFCRYASGAGGSQLGAYRGDADTSTAAQVPNAKFGQATSGANQLTYIEHL